MKHKTYLVVEDEGALLGLITAVLGRKHIITSGAENAYVALDYLKDGEHPDLILTDYNLPGIKGLDFILSAQKDFGYKGPVVFMTGRVDSLLSEANNRKFDIQYLLPKPFGIDLFYKTLESAISKVPQR